MEGLEEILLENGIVTDLNESDEPLEMDSITFASLVISIENQYGITVPSNMLLYEKWKTKTMIERNITNLRGIVPKT
jgi:acyl carrier protein